MEKLIDALATEFAYDPYDRESVRALIAEYAAEQYEDGYQDGQSLNDEYDL